MRIYARPWLGPTCVYTCTSVARTDLDPRVVNPVAVGDKDLQQLDLLVEQREFVVAPDELRAQDVPLTDQRVQLALLTLDHLVGDADHPLQVLLLRPQVHDDLITTMNGAIQSSAEKYYLCNSDDLSKTEIILAA